MFHRTPFVLPLFSGTFYPCQRSKVYPWATFKGKMIVDRELRELKEQEK